MAEPRAPQRQAGLSLLEAVVALALVTLVLGLFYEMILGSLRASLFSESRNDLTVVSQRLTNSIHTDVIQAKLAFQEDALGMPYRDLVEDALPAGIDVWSPSRLPLIDQNTTVLGPDPGPNGLATRTGNSLLIARQLAPLAVPWNHDADAATPEIEFLADRYQFAYYFLRANPERNFAGLGHYLEVLRAEGPVLADYFQLADISVNQAQVAAGVRAAGIELAWNPGQPLDAPGFYDISGGGAFAPNPAPALALEVKSLLADFAGGRISGAMEYSVAPNPTASMHFQDPVPLYATASSGFPQGLEFQIVGGSGSRKALTRLVLAAFYQGQFTTREASVTSSARGF